MPCFLYTHQCNEETEKKNWFLLFICCPLPSLSRFNMCQLRFDLDGQFKSTFYSLPHHLAKCVGSQNSFAAKIIFSLSFAPKPIFAKFCCQNCCVTTTTTPGVNLHLVNLRDSVRQSVRHNGEFSLHGQKFLSKPAWIYYWIGKISIKTSHDWQLPLSVRQIGAIFSFHLMFL